MGKKKRQPKNKYLYTRDEFIMTVCSKCGICGKSSDPIFCFDTAYIDEPKKFIKRVLPKLEKNNEWLIENKYENINFCPDDEVQNILISTFCKSGYCGNWMGGKDKCDYFIGCLSVLRRQFYSIKSDERLDSYQTLKEKYSVKLVKNGVACGYSSKKFNRKNVVKEVKRHPTPSFFCRDGFENRIKSIIYGNDNRKSDKIKRCAGFTERFVNREPEDTESKVSGSTISGKECMEHSKNDN